MRGLYGKYHIEKADGSPVDPQADYFVLRLDTDTNARVAALAYADACEFKNPQLAADLRARVKKHVHSYDEAMEVAAGSMAREMRDEVDGRIIDCLTKPTPPLTSFPKNGLMCSVCGEPQYATPHGATCGTHGGADGFPPAMLEMPDGKLVPQNGPEDRATWWTCTQCGFTGPAVGSNPEGEHRCMGIICGGKTLNPNSPKSPGWREKR